MKKLIILLIVLVTSFYFLPAALADCGLTSTGQVPLMDLGTNLYQTYEGGLYPNGLNTPPATYAAEGEAIANTITPLNANGQPAGNGKIVLLAIGMSNTKKEFDYFFSNDFRDLKQAGLVNPKVLPINGAQQGQTLSIWADPNSSPWTNVENILDNRNLTTNQVQVVWVKLAEDFPYVNGAFPAHAEVYKDNLEQVVANIASKYPNAKIVYFSSRARAYTDVQTQLSPEPYAYEEGFGVKWLIEDKINGLMPNTPYLAWGPYLWIDGLNPRSDGYIWGCSNVESDFMHPSTSGAQKVAGMLINFLLNDNTATPWFLD